MKDELLYHEYAGWLLEYDKLIKSLKKLKSPIYDRIKNILDVVDYFYNKLIDDPEYNEEDHNIFETGFYYLFDQVEEIRGLLEEVYNNNIENLNKEADKVNLLLTTIDFQNELITYEEFDEKDMQFLLNFETEIIEKLNKQINFDDKMFKKLDDETYKMFNKMDIEYYPIETIFLEIAYEIGIKEWEIVPFHLIVMLAKQVLKQRVLSKLKTNILVLLIGLFAFGYGIFDLIKNINDPTLVIFSIILITISLIISIFNIYFIWGITKDLIDLKKDIVYETTSKFIKYSKKDKNKLTYTNQVFLDLKTKSELILFVDGIIHNSTYKIIYLKRSKIGVPIEKI